MQEETDGNCVLIVDNAKIPTDEYMTTFTET